MEEMTLTLNSPITEEQLDAILDADFEHTNEIVSHTKHGKIVKFVMVSAQPEPYEEDEELDFVQEHKKLPIILETREKAHWIEVGREEGAIGIEYKRLKCSKCGWESSLPIPRNFCPECGAYYGGKDETKASSLLRW